MERPGAEDELTKMPMWKSYLYHLQQQAPNPKRIVCQREIANKPAYYGKEYHGAISREDADFMLTIGGEGSYLIRESQRAPGQYTLAIRFDGVTKNFKLYFDGQHYVGEKHFDQVQDLVADGLITFYLESKAADYIAALSSQSNYAESPYVAYNTQKKWQMQSTNTKSAAAVMGGMRQRQPVTSSDIIRHHSPGVSSGPELKLNSGACGGRDVTDLLVATPAGQGRGGGVGGMVGGVVGGVKMANLPVERTRLSQMIESRRSQESQVIGSAVPGGGVGVTGVSCQPQSARMTTQVDSPSSSFSTPQQNPALHSSQPSPQHPPQPAQTAVLVLGGSGGSQVIPAPVLSGVSGRSISQTPARSCVNSSPQVGRGASAAHGGESCQPSSSCCSSDMRITISTNTDGPMFDDPHFSTPPSSPPLGSIQFHDVMAGKQVNLKASSVTWCTDYLEVMGCEKPHHFKLHTFKGPHWCDYCANFLWGLIAQGVKCQDCGFNAHKKCSEKVPNDCMPDMKYVKRMFGIDLTTLVKAQNTLIPVIVELCIKEIEARGQFIITNEPGLKSEGLYRLAGFHDDVETIKMSFDKDGELTDISEERYDDLNTIASVLKLYFRLLPIPLITFDIYFKVIDTVKRDDILTDKKFDMIRHSLAQLPPAHYHTLKYLMAHLHRVAEQQQLNMMSAENLAIVFAPTLLRSPETDPLISLSAVKYERELIEILILHHTILFD